MTQILASVIYHGLNSKKVQLHLGNVRTPLVNANTYENGAIWLSSYLAYVFKTTNIFRLNKLDLSIVSDIHEARPHKGQKAVARRMRSLLHSETHQSEIAGKIPGSSFFIVLKV